MIWNHRVIRHPGQNGTTNEPFHAIHEVYYDGDDHAITGWTQAPVAPMGSSLEELRSELAMFVLALDKPVLQETPVPGDDTDTATRNSTLTRMESGPKSPHDNHNERVPDVWSNTRI